MKNTIKSMVLVLSAPVIISYAFSVNQIKTELKRSPAVVKVEKSVKIHSLRSDVFNYLVSVK
jgi:hypothetical protein